MIEFGQKLKFNKLLKNIMTFLSIKVRKKVIGTILFGDIKIKTYY